MFKKLTKKLLDYVASPDSPSHLVAEVQPDQQHLVLFLGACGFHTRTGADGNAKFHDGIDIAATPGTNLHTALSGEVTKVNSSFTPGQYLKNSYGNYVEIHSTYLGKKIYLKYNHMNGIANNLTVGSTVMAGDIIGMTGTTPGVIPHVHIQSKDADYKKTDPSPYIRSKFDTSTDKKNEKSAFLFINAWHCPFIKHISELCTKYN